MTDLRQHYLDYLTTLDERRFADLHRYVADELTYNDGPTTLERYRADREHDARIFPDLAYDVRELLVDGDRVAARIAFDCTPVEPFRGFAPTGARVRFDEHVLYRFADLRIVEVRSLLDVDALARQLPRTGA